MLYRLTEYIRNKYHPLFKLRQSKLFVRYIMPIFDITIGCKLWRVEWKVYLHLLRHLSLLLNSRITEPGIGALFLALSKTFSPRIFWDIGANVGGYSWLLMSANKDLRAVLFEPDPDNAKLIETTISRANLKNAYLIRSAVSNQSGTANFALDKASSATGSLITEKTFNQRLFGHKPDCIKVETVTLDNLWKIKKLPAPDLIKIDVEMAEHLVFEGAKNLIRESQPVIIFECCASNKESLTKELLDIGYTIFAADHPSESADSALNLLALPARYASDHDRLIDAWRKECADW